MSKPSGEKNDLHDSDLYWRTTIKYKIQRFPFLTIMERPANILITSLIKAFAMFEFILIVDRNTV